MKKIVVGEHELEGTTKNYEFDIGRKSICIFLTYLLVVNIIHVVIGDVFN
jgi:hypothetical protein